MTIGETMTKTAEEASLSGEEGSGLPASVTDVPRELLKSFPHTKKVGNYLLGKTLGEGSFAKVKEGLHILTGEKVRENLYARSPGVTCCSKFPDACNCPLGRLESSQRFA